MAELALHVLDGSGVRGCATGAPCLLSEAERPFLAEDLKTLGILPRRLREMLKFLEKGLADLSDRDEGWLIMAEEELVLRTLRDQLTIRHATLPCEAANLACQFLESPQGAARLAELRVPCVLADGWTSYNRASQRLVALLAGQRLIAAGYEGDPGVAAIPYSNGCGLEEVRAAFGPQLASDVTLDRATSERESITWEFPDDEFRGLAERAAAELAQGRAASDVVVVAPTRSWGRRAVRALEGRGVPVDETLGAPHGEIGRAHV